jgi:hypothetical protein
MRISKMVLNLSMFAIVAGFATTASANFSCNASSKVPMKYDSNPKTRLASASLKKSEPTPKKSTSQRNKGTAG